MGPPPGSVIIGTDPDLDPSIEKQNKPDLKVVTSEKIGGSRVTSTLVGMEVW